MGTNPRGRPTKGRTWPQQSGRSGVWVGVLALLGIVAFFPTALATNVVDFCPHLPRDGPVLRRVACRPARRGGDVHRLPRRRRTACAVRPQVRRTRRGQVALPRRHNLPPSDASRSPQRTLHALSQHSPPTTEGGFSHKIHAEKGTCATCHPATGHDVTAAKLQAAGIFNASVKRTALPGEFATVDGGQANIKGHKKVPCSRCHDMAKTGCARCHKPKSGTKHPWKGECTQCHETGNEFAFKHPTSTTAQSAMSPGTSTSSPYRGSCDACKTCHPTPGDDWKFSHPGASRRLRELPQAASKALCRSVLAVPPSVRAPPGSFSHPAGRGALMESPAVRKLPPQELHLGAYCTCHGGKAPND